MTNITNQIMNNHKATPKQWENVEGSPWSSSACLLELRARVAELEKKQIGVTNYGQFLVDVVDRRLEQLEAQAGNLKGSLTSSTPPPVATDEELRAIWNFEGTWNECFRAVYNFGVAHGKASSRDMLEQEAGR
jgi:hypothetical protein